MAPIPAMTGHVGPGVPSLAVVATDTSAINGAGSAHLWRAPCQALVSCFFIF
jgi:hypothetical protein